VKKLAALSIVVVTLVVTSPAYAQAAAGSHGGRPWWRLAIFVPVSVLVGAGVVVGRRIARNRGWFGS